MISNQTNTNTTNVPVLNLTVTPVRTRYVMVAKTDDDYLSLAEVQVMGF